VPFPAVSRSRGGPDECLVLLAIRAGAEARRGVDLVAFKLHLRLAPAHASALRSHVELVLFEGAHAGLHPVEDGRANLCPAELAASHYLLGGSAQSYPRLLARDVGPQVLLATAIFCGIVSSAGRAALRAVTALLPGLMSRVAKQTRASERAIGRASLTSRAVV
jgi:hypothetical protein